MERLVNVLFMVDLTVRTEADTLQEAVQQVERDFGAHLFTREFNCTRINIHSAGSAKVAGTNVKPKEEEYVEPKQEEVPMPDVVFTKKMKEEYLREVLSNCSVAELLDLQQCWNNKDKLKVLKAKKKSTKKKATRGKVQK